MDSDLCYHRPCQAGHARRQVKPTPYGSGTDTKGRSHAIRCDHWEDDRLKFHPEQYPELVKSFLDNRSKDRPLCLMVGDHRPHVRWSEESTYDPAKALLPEYLIDTKETREHWARYLTDVTGMDTLIGQVDQMAREHFGSDDYLFLHSSDHGAQWPFAKWNLYDAGIRVPMIVRWPRRIRAGVRTKAMVSWIDVMPTLIDLAGGKVPRDIDGESFADVLLGKEEEHRDVIYTTHSGVYPIRSVRTSRFKYIRNLLPDCYHTNASDRDRKDGAGAYWDSWDEAAKSDQRAAAIIARYYQRPAVELYDLAKDPTEQNNLAGNPAYQERIDTMSSMLDEWMKEQGDEQTVYGEPYPVSGPVPHLVAHQENRDAKGSKEEMK